MSSNIDQQLKEIITNLAYAFSRETLEENQDIVTKLKNIKETSKNFWDLCEISQRRINTILSALLEIPPQKNVYITEHIASGLYEHFIKRYIQNIEGSGCSVDKSGFIKRMTIKALQSQENLSLYEDYTGCERINKAEWDKQAYWSPKTIKDTDMAMNMFWDWYLLREQQNQLSGLELAKIGIALKELKNYQDTGLSPEEIKQLKAYQPVRCGECIHFVRIKNFDNECGITGGCVNETDYCSSGERRGNDETLD